MVRPASGALRSDELAQLHCRRRDGGLEAVEDHRAAQGPARKGPERESAGTELQKKGVVDQRQAAGARPR
eukprot:scaffold5293_cov114-Isochrysis_galbana.AAC.6